MSEILVFSDNDHYAFELLSGGKRFKDGLEGVHLSAAVMGNNAEARAVGYFAYGAEKVYLGNDILLNEFYADIYAEALYQIVLLSQADVVLITSTKRGKELAPRVAQKLGAGCVIDAIGFKINDGTPTIDRYAFGGKTIVSETITTSKKVISIMPKTFEMEHNKPGQDEIIKVPLKLSRSKLTILEKREKKGESINLESAEAIVCVGRGINKKEDLATIELLAKVVKAEIGCTRPLAHDLQWYTEAREVGLSGKKCKPRLCFSIGISGQIQHTVGIRDSRIIVAVNKDKNAPIFEIADYGIVGDLYEVVPKIINKVQR